MITDSHEKHLRNVIGIILKKRRCADTPELELNYHNPYQMPESHRIPRHVVKDLVSRDVTGEGERILSEGTQPNHSAGSISQIPYSVLGSRADLGLGSLRNCLSHPGAAKMPRLDHFKHTPG